MERELLILTQIEQQEDATQRDIARETGMALGSVNLLLREMTKKGLVKIERLNARSVRYMLTPKGLKEKTEKTYKYIKRSYDHIMSVTRSVGEILQSAHVQQAGFVYLYGPRNEIYQIIKMALQQQQNVRYQHFGPGEPPEAAPGAVILVWRLEDEQELTGFPGVINLLRSL